MHLRVFMLLYFSVSCVTRGASSCCCLSHNPFRTMHIQKRWGVTHFSIRVPFFSGTKWTNIDHSSLKCCREALFNNFVGYCIRFRTAAQTPAGNRPVLSNWRGGAKFIPSYPTCEAATTSAATPWNPCLKLISRYLQHSLPSCGQLRCIYLTLCFFSCPLPTCSCEATIGREKWQTSNESDRQPRARYSTPSSK